MTTPRSPGRWITGAVQTGRWAMLLSDTRRQGGLLRPRWSIRRLVLTKTTNEPKWEMAKKKPASKKSVKPPPRCKAILLCDQAIVEAVTGKVSLIGIFDRFAVRRFPGHIRQFTAFLQLTDGIGQYRITVEVHDLREDKILARAAIVNMTFADRSGKANLMIPVPPLLLKHPGGYDFVVLADDQEIDRQQFQAHGIGDQANDGNAAKESD